MAGGLLAASAAAPIVGSYIGEKMSESDRRRQEQMIKDVASLYEGIEVPDLEGYTPEVAQYMGDLTAPDIAVAEQQQSEFGGITTDPRLAEAQYGALGSLQDIIEGGGMTDMERLNAQRAMDQAQAAATSQAADIQQDMARRGMSGGGQEMLARLAASQGSVNRAAQMSQDQQAIAQQRALDAIMQRGDLGGQMRSQQFGEQADVAAAKDAARRFNIQNALSQGNLGAQLGMEAQARNIATKQQLEGQRAAGETGARQYAAGLPAQQFGMEMQKVGGQAQGRQGLANMYGQRAGQTAQKWAGYGRAAGTGAAAAGQYAAAQPAAAPAPPPVVAPALTYEEPNDRVVPGQRYPSRY